MVFHVGGVACDVLDSEELPDDFTVAVKLAKECLSCLKG
jgi:hypothetical protein